MLRKAGYCALTGKLVQNAEEWKLNNSSDTYRLREIVATKLTSTPKPLPQRRGLWDSVVSHTKLVEEFDSPKRTKRHGRLSTALKFLKDHNILLHSQYLFNQATGTWNVTNEFERVVLVGETYLQREIATRMQKLLPDADAEQLRLLIDASTSVETLAKLFDKFNLNRNLDPKFRKQNKLTPLQKATAILGILGELQWFVVKTKATDRTHNNALFPPSDVLILHVLSVHCQETVCGECIVDVVGDHVENFKDKWTNFGESIPMQMTTKPKTAGMYLLNTVPKPHEETPSTQMEGNSSSTCVPKPIVKLSDAPVYGALTAKQEGMELKWHRMDTMDGVTKEEKVAVEALKAMSIGSPSPPINDGSVAASA